MSASPTKKGNGLIIGVIVAAILAVVGYVVYIKFVKKPASNGSGSGGGSNGSSSSQGTQSSGGSNSVTITANDVNDPFPRDIQIFTSDPSGKYSGGGEYSGMSNVASSVVTSGGSWTVNLNKGTYYLIVGQSGGASYGTYAGSITPTGQNPISYQGVDCNHAARFTI